MFIINKNSFVLVLLILSSIVSNCSCHLKKSEILKEKPPIVVIEDSNKIDHYQIKADDEMFDNDIITDTNCPEEQALQGEQNHLIKDNSRAEKWTFVATPIKEDSISESLSFLKEHDEMFEENIAKEECQIEQQINNLLSLMLRKGLKHLKDDLSKQNPLEEIKQVKKGEALQRNKIPAPEATQSEQHLEIGQKGFSGNWDKSELEQQQELGYQKPVFMYTQTDQVELQDGVNSIKDVKKSEQKQQQQQQVDSFEAATAERARNSLLLAADVARQLSNVTQNSSSPSLPTSFLRMDWPDQKVSSSRKMDDRVEKKVKTSSHREINSRFLGFGQLQRIEPFNGNQRLQARMSCQFGSEQNQSANITISDVQWVKFDNYKMNYETEPPFDCNEVLLLSANVGSSIGAGGKCQMTPVKTNVLTTVHPRPAIQNYVNTMVPSYSVTLHDVNQDHLGVYRCSAMRQFGDGQKEMVYRIIEFE